VRVSGIGDPLGAMAPADACAALSDDCLSLIANSHARLTGRDLVARAGNLRDALWNASAVIEMDWSAFVGMPSRLSAEPLLREERSRLLERVSRDGFIADYAGIRIAASGRRFRIERAVVWNLIDADGTCHGQAATFDCWTPS
jgi:MEKHLA domain